MWRVSVLASAVLAASASAIVAQTKASDLPPVLNPEHLAIYLDLSATGVQIYACRKTAAGAFAWTLTAPEATLSDAQHRATVKHYAGPSWEDLDGGKVSGTVKASVPAPVAGAIPWLLLDIKSREGRGALTQAAAIVRMNTNGGVAPAQGCDEAHAGAEARVPYTATYLFLK